MLFSSGPMALCHAGNQALRWDIQNKGTSTFGLHFSMFCLVLLAVQQGRVCGITVLASFPGGISVILILNCGTAVFSKAAKFVFFAFWSTIAGIKDYPPLFSDHF